MKRTLAIILVVAMLVCMLPAFSLVSIAAEDDETTYGLNAAYYHQLTYEDVVGTTTGRDPWCKFDDVRRFTSSIDGLIEVSYIDAGNTKTGLTSIAPPKGADNYVTKWEGTITAETEGEYTFVGRKIDNGFAAYVDQNGNGTFEADELFYEYWAINHWFDGAEERLVSEQGAFTLEANKPTAIQMWYLEADGGEGCSINVSTEGGANDKSFADAKLTLALDQTVYDYVYHEAIRNALGAGVKPDGTVAGDDNGCLANMEGNHKYDESIEGILDLMVKVGTTVVPNYESEAFASGNQFGWHYDNSAIDYTGYVTPTVGGTYQFGTSRVDNCLMVEIEINGEWVTVYEFWAKNVWNDISTTYSDTVVTLEEGKSYPIHATFLEINGGEAIESKIKVNDEEKSMAESQLVFTTEPLKTAPVTEYFFSTGSEWHYMTSGEGNTQTAPEGWATDSDIYGTWNKANANLHDAWGTSDIPVNNNKSLWAVKEFTVEDLDAIADLALAMNINYDDNICLYINGKLVYQEYYWSADTETWKIANKASDLLVEGTNVIAASLVQGHGGWGFDMGLYVTNTISASDLVTYITTLDEFYTFVDAVNAAENKGADLAAVLGADLDFTGKTWTPIGEFRGQLYGNGHSIKNITYTSTGTGVEGMFINTLVHTGSDKDAAIVDGIVFENCVYKTSGLTVGLVAGTVDHALVRNVTVKNCEIDCSTGINAAAIAGDVKWECSLKNIVDCTVENTTVTATKTASGLAVYIWSEDGTIVMDHNTLINVTLNADEQYADVSNKDGNISVTDLVVKSQLDASIAGDYTFYYQTRTGVNGTTDYRIICVAKTEWVTSQSEIKVDLSFTNGTDTVSKSEIATVAYKTITANGDGYTDIYTPAEGNVIFGWVVTGVPADYAAIRPTASVVD